MTHGRLCVSIRKTVQQSYPRSRRDFFFLRTIVMKILPKIYKFYEWQITGGGQGNGAQPLASQLCKGYGGVDFTLPYPFKTTWEGCGTSSWPSLEKSRRMSIGADRRPDRNHDELLGFLVK